MATTIVEHFQVAPSSGAPKELLLPLLYSDVAFLNYPLMQHLCFYSFQCSKSHFFDTIVGNLKNSLSLALKHFPPFAGNIIFPLTTATTTGNNNNNNMPASQYVAGDSISMTIAVSKADLIPLTGNLSRDADQFHHFIAQIPPATYSPESIKFSVAAVRVTLFPNQGICIGLTNHHAIGDATTLAHFVKTWATINKLPGGALLSPPSYDRSGVQDAESLTRAFWELMKVNKPVVSTASLSDSSSSPTDQKVLATFVLSGAHIQLLKKFVLSKKPSSTTRLSSFTIACAHLWASFARSPARGGAQNNNNNNINNDDDDDDEPHYFLCPVNCRGRLNPPLPDTYFGNCVTIVMAESTQGRLKGERGIVVAAEAIGEAIRKTLTGISDGRSLNLVFELQRIRRSGKRFMGVIGSPQLDLYEIDFGWGRVKKYEFIRVIDGDSLMLSKSRESQGGVDVVLSMPKAKVDAFTTAFNQGLSEAAQSISNIDHFSKL